MFKPMLAHDFDKHKHKLSYPLYVQPKINGVRMVTESGAWASRNGKPLRLPPELRQDIISFTSHLSLDGELYEHGRPLEHILGTCKKLTSKSPGIAHLKYYIFDTPTSGTFNHRYNLLLRDLHTTHHLRLVPTVVALTERVIHQLLASFLSQGYEGVMVREANGTYHNKRHWHLLKLKPWVKGVGTIISFVEGKGKNEGMLGAFLILLEGNETTVGSGLTDGERKAIWEDMEKFRFRGVGVRFRERTSKGLPRHCVVDREDPLTMMLMEEASKQ